MQLKVSDSIIKTTKLQKENNETKDFSFIYCELAEYYLNSNQINKAKAYYKLATKLIKTEDNDTYHYYKKLKSYYLYKDNKPKQALAIAKQILDDAEKQPHTQNVIDAQKLLYQIFKVQKNFVKALEYYNSYNNLEDSIVNIERLNLQNYHHTLPVKKINSQTRKKQTDIVTISKGNNNKLLLFIILIFISFSIFTIVYILLSNKYSKRKEKLQKLYSQNLLSYIDNERKRISKGSS
ncbi:tetratricopeptide repeat protein [Tenacibaculum sp. nBUS_03]|uniref:tetratricopeptide repeat protein n=1 Tax=Tenacibaculum sp. nBUS_03 TaxID=3395320 RepID=UPI003EC11E6B